MNTLEIERMAKAAGFCAVPHDGKVIVSRLGSEQALAVVSPIPGSTNGIKVCVPAMMDLTLRNTIATAFSRRLGEPWREVSIVLSGARV